MKRPYWKKETAKNYQSMELVVRLPDGSGPLPSSIWEVPNNDLTVWGILDGEPQQPTDGNAIVPIVDFTLEEREGLINRRGEIGRKIIELRERELADQAMPTTEIIITRQ